VPESVVTALLGLSSGTETVPIATEHLNPEIQEHHTPVETGNRHPGAVHSSEPNPGFMTTGSNNTPLAAVTDPTGTQSALITTAIDTHGRLGSGEISASLDRELLVKYGPRVAPTASLKLTSTSLRKFRLFANCAGSLTDRTVTRLEGFALNLQQTYSKTIESAEQRAAVLLSQCNFLEAEKLYLNALHCRNHLSENWPYWPTLADKVTPMLGLASLYDSIDETGSKIRVLEDIMIYFEAHDTGSEDLRLTETMTNLFCAYTDSYRVLADSGIIQTPLHQAVMFGNPAVVSFVLDTDGVRFLDDRGFQGQTALHMATERNSVTIARLLVAKNADLDLLSIPGEERALEIAVNIDSFECFCLLFDASLEIKLANKKYRFFQALAGVIRQNKPRMLGWLLEKDFNFNSMFWDEMERAFVTPLEVAILSRRIELVAVLLQRGARVSLRDRTGTHRNALFRAVTTNDSRIVELLLEHGAPINDIEEVPLAISRLHITPLGLAIYRGFADVAISLIRKGANVHNCTAAGSDTELAPLLVACKTGNENVVKQLILYGAKVMETKGILQEACILSHQGIVKLLLQNGADPNSCNGLFGETALQVACRVADEDIVRLLLENGGNVNAPNNMSVLRDACTRKHAEIVKTLLHHGADINSEENKDLLAYVCNV
jgi:ankyrin repeat protein